MCMWHVAYLAAEHTRLEHSQLVGIAVYLLLTSHYFISAQRHKDKDRGATEDNELEPEGEQGQSKEKRLSQARGPCAMCHVPYALCHVVLCVPCALCPLPAGAASGQTTRSQLGRHTLAVYESH